MRHLSFVAAVACAALLGYIDLVQADILLPFLLLVLSTFTLGAFAPRKAWLWGLLIGCAVPLAQAGALAVGFETPYPNAVGETWFVPLAGLIAAYAGVLTRRVVELV
jgi:hypothetical protein